MSDMGTRLFIKAALQKQQKGLPDDLFQFFTGIRKDILDVDRFFLLCCSFHHATILKNWNGKTYVRALVRYVSSVSITVRPSQNSNLATPMNKSISVKKIFMMMTKNGEDAVANRIQQRFFCMSEVGMGDFIVKDSFSLNV